MSSGFISETELAEQRKIRQEEWDRVRTTDQPLEAPEVPYDPRCLYDRLQEQKNKKDLEYEEAHTLKNMIKGLDDDEVEFLDLVDRQKMEEQRKKKLEEEKEMEDFKAAVASLQEKSMDERLKLELKQPQVTNKSSSSHKNSQLKLLAGVVKRPVAKTENGSSPQGTKRKLSDTEGSTSDSKADTASDKQTSEGTSVQSSSNSSELQTGALKCIGILPGLGDYENSSDSDSSSGSEPDAGSGCKRKKVDILGREIVPHKEKEGD